MSEDIYQQHGYKNRADYLMSLADMYGVPYDTVLMAAYTLGPGEDFDGLPTMLEDWED